MKKIYKYKLPRDGQSITVDDYVLEWLRPGVQDGWPHIWAVVDTERSGMTTEIVAWGTGWPLPDDVYYGTEYLGTVEDGAGFVWHYFAEEKVAQSTTDVWNSDYLYKYGQLNTSAGNPTEPYTITISCGDGSAASAVTVGDWDPTISTACTGTISTDQYVNSPNVTIDWDYLRKLLAEVDCKTGATLALK